MRGVLEWFAIICMAFSSGYFGTTALKAPAPVAKDAPQFDGAYDDSLWGAVPVKLRFVDGRYDCEYIGSNYCGSYDWHNGTRTLTVTETCPEQPTISVTWTAVLDSDMKGSARRDGRDTIVHLRRRP